MVVGQVKAILIDGHNVLGCHKQIALDTLDKRQRVGLSRVIKEFNHISLVRVVDDEKPTDPGLCLGILEPKERHACGVKVVRVV